MFISNFSSSPSWNVYIKVIKNRSFKFNFFFISSSNFISFLFNNSFISNKLYFINRPISISIGFKIFITFYFIIIKYLFRSIKRRIFTFFISFNVPFLINFIINSSNRIRSNFYSNFLVIYINILKNSTIFFKIKHMIKLLRCIINKSIFYISSFTIINIPFSSIINKFRSSIMYKFSFNRSISKIISHDLQIIRINILFYIFKFISRNFSSFIRF